MNQQNELDPIAPAPDAPVQRTVTEARQAVTPHVVRYVLGIGLLLAVIALAIVLAVWVI